MTQGECVYESCHATMSLLVYESATPNMALLGYEPRDLYALDNRALQAYKAARSTRPDALESTMRGRLIAMMPSSLPSLSTELPKRPTPKCSSTIQASLTS